jgi:cyclopropane-fatty-acyl-phospholipid synthase
MTQTLSFAGSDLNLFSPSELNEADVNRFRYQLTRLAASGFNTVQMAMAEAYINGLEVPDELLKSMINGTMPVLFKHFPGLLAPYEWVLKESTQVADSARRLMKVQYDMPQQMLNRMMGDWPDVYPKYSMGLWEHGATDLRESQIHMMDQFVERAEIKDGDNILDFGCGWGCVANYILEKFPNTRITGLNLSRQQCNYMRDKMIDPSSQLSSGRFTLIEGDMNEVEFQEKFDKIISIGVFCHVGNLSQIFERFSSMLNPGGGVLIHIITARIPNNMSSGFTHKYIFPHGRYWHHDALPSHSRHLRTVKRWYINGINYHQTLASWLQRFDASQGDIKLLNYGMPYQRFRRIWRFYLILLGTIFATCDGEYNGNGQYLMVPR